MATILITGANRGIGLELARGYSGRGERVIATARDPNDAGELSALPNVTMLPLDLADAASTDAFVATLGSTPLDILVSNAGVYGPAEPERQAWQDTLLVNTVAPTLLALRLRANLRAGTLKKAVAISSRMGSIADNASGGSMVYRSSKAALNAAWATLAIDWRADGIAVAVLHPGWVKTRMGGANAPLDVPTSAAGLTRVIDALDISATGRFFDQDGTIIPW